MLDKIKFNQTEIPFPLTWNEKSNTVKKLFNTEAGTDEEIIVRRDKLNVSCSFKSTDTWVRQFKEFSMMNSFTLTQYDPLTNAVESRTVRMVDFNYGLVPKSYDLDVTKGVWNVSFTLEEF